MPSGVAAPEWGAFNPVHPSRNMVLGSAFLSYWQQLDPSAQAYCAQQAAEAGVVRVVCAQDALGADLGAWQAAGITVEHAPEKASTVLYRHRQQQRQALPTQTIHGVLVSVFGLGVLILGASGVGKSETAIDLISRGHFLVADDAVEVQQSTVGVLCGRSTALLAGFIEARGLGILDVAACFGPQALQASQRLDLAIRLDNLVPSVLTAEERLHGRRSVFSLWQTSIPCISLTVGLGHNLAAMVELACRDHWLRQSGYSADIVFVQQQAAALRSQ